MNGRTRRRIEAAAEVDVDKLGRRPSADQCLAGSGRPTSMSSKRRTSGRPPCARATPVMASSFGVLARQATRRCGDRQADAADELSAAEAVSAKAAVSGVCRNARLRPAPCPRSTQAAQTSGPQELRQLVGCGHRRQTGTADADIGRRPAVDQLLAGRGMVCGEPDAGGTVRTVRSGAGAPSAVTRSCVRAGSSVAPITTTCTGSTSRP